MPVEGYFYPGGNNITLQQYPTAPWGWSTAAASAYSGSTSANGASTHSTMSYYVQPFYVDHPINVSKIEMIGSFSTVAAGTGSVTMRDYFGLYKISSDSLTLVSSWLAGQNASMNSNTAISLSVVTGSASASIISFGGNSTSAANGVKLFPLAQGAASMIGPDQYFAVYGAHEITNGIVAVTKSLGVQANSYVEIGRTDVTNWAPLNGAFSSTSSATLAGAGQYLMPPSVATNAVTATRTNEQLRPPIMLRGI